VKGVSAGVRVAILFLLLAIAGYIVWKNLGQSPAGKDTQELFARFHDASGLPKGSKVVIAGLPKGEVYKLDVEGRYAKISFRLSSDIPVWSNAAVIKKASSLLGENYLEVDPGEEKRQLPDGTVQAATPLGLKCADYDSPDKVKRDKCREIPHVVEATTVDQLLHRIEQTLPNVDRVLESVRDLSEDLRRVVNGPLSNTANRIDGLVQKNADSVQDIIQRADHAAQNIDAIAADLRAISKDADPRIQDLLKNLDEASAEAKELVVAAKQDLNGVSDKLNQKLDKLDGVIDNTKDITQKINDDKGTIGKLVNEPQIADNIEQITDDAKGFLGTLFGLKAYVGLRTEYDFVQGLTRSYVTAELHTRPDKYYLIELEKGPRGVYPDVTLTFDPTVDPNHWIRRAVISDGFSFTFQFAKRFAWLTVRYGVKESTGGVGADADAVWWGRNLRLSTDVYDATFDKYPRLKITAMIELVRHLYLLGGVDDAINRPRDLGCPYDGGACEPIIKGQSDVPIEFNEVHLGRDYFLGAMLRFNDEDLAALLTVAGSTLTGAAK